MKQIFTMEIAREMPGTYHIPGVHNTQQTLCGFVDAPGSQKHFASEHPCNCSACMEAYQDIKGYFAEGCFTGDESIKAKTVKSIVIPSWLARREGL